MPLTFVMSKISLSHDSRVVPVFFHINMKGCMSLNVLPFTCNCHENEVGKYSK